MAPGETLLNATLVVMPLWLGLVRYVTREVEFRNRVEANTVVLGIVAIFMAILFSLVLTIGYLSDETPELTTALYTLFVALFLTGIGGLFLVTREIDEASNTISIGVPIAILFGGGLYAVIAWIVDNASPAELIQTGTRIVALLSAVVALLAILVWIALRTRLWLLFIVPERYIGRDPIWEEFDIEGWSRANDRDGLGLAFCFVPPYPWPIHVLAYDAERVYSSGYISEMSVDDWVDESRYRFVLRRRIG